MINRILFSSPELLLEKRTTGERALPDLGESRIIEARVQGRLSPTLLELLIDGTSVTARTRIPLKPGDLVQLEVLKHSLLQELRFIGLKQEAPSGGRGGFPKEFGRFGPHEQLTKLVQPTAGGSRPAAHNSASSQPLSPMQQLKILTEIALQGQKPDQGINVQAFVKGGEAGWEQKLATLLVSGRAVVTANPSLGSAVAEVVEHLMEKLAGPLSEKAEGRPAGPLSDAAQQWGAGKTAGKIPGTSGEKAIEAFSQVAGQKLPEKRVENQGTGPAKKQASMESSKEIVKSTAGRPGAELQLSDRGRSDATLLERAGKKITGKPEGREGATPVKPDPAGGSAFDRLEKIVGRLNAQMSPSGRKEMEAFMGTRSMGWEEKVSLLLLAKPGPSARMPGPSAQMMLEPLESLVENMVSRMKADQRILGAYERLAQREEVKLAQKGELAREMGELLDKTALKSEGFDRGLVRRMIRSSGFTWESRVAQAVSGQADAGLSELPGEDLKAIAMKFASLLQGDDEVARTLNSFVDGVEKMQLLNMRSFEESGKYLLPLPFLSDETWRFGQLLVDLGEKEGDRKKNGERMIRVAFLLSMSRLGDVRADFAILKKRLSGIFTVCDEEVCRLVHEEAAELVKRLDLHGFQVTGIKCRVEEPGVLANASLADEIVENRDGMVSVVI